MTGGFGRQAKGCRPPSFCLHASSISPLATGYAYDHFGIGWQSLQNAHDKLNNGFFGYWTRTPASGEMNTPAGCVRALSQTAGVGRRGAGHFRRLGGAVVLDCGARTRLRVLGREGQGEGQGP